MKIERLILGPLQTNCWLVSDGAGGPLVIIDPADEADVVLASVKDRKVSALILTHGHFDHLAAAGELVAATGAGLLVHVADAPWITSPAGTGGTAFGFEVAAPAATRELRDGDFIAAGDLSFAVLHTPGHTPGCICLYADGHLFSGDTLFAGSVGRTDFPRGDSEALLNSIAQKIAPLPADTVVHPGHGPDTTIRRERTINPFFPRG
ncbi:MAG: MBL fold metallo-hydrolase [Actinobacteria bacterium]|nr:MBL fold metallo-hydrolase [Actinomycetota bacterium]